LESWRTLAASPWIEWAQSSLDDAAFAGLDPADGTGFDLPDPLDRKLPDMTFQGERFPQAIQKVLTSAGTHTWRLDYVATGDTSKPYVSRVRFCPVGYTAAFAGAGIDVPLLRGGDADDPNTAHDFALRESAAEVCESVLVEGAPVHVETAVTWDNTDASTIAASALKPAWSNPHIYNSAAGETAAYNEQTAFMYCVNGGTSSGSPGQWAKYPAKQGDVLSPSSWLNADGASGRPFAFARTLRAIALARQQWPRVFRAWRLDTAQLGTALSGYGSAFSSVLTYPRLRAARPILAEQLQFFIYDILGGQEEANWTNEKYPIRVQIKMTADTDYHEVPQDVALRVTGDGLIWLDNLAEAADDQDHCVYAGSLLRPTGVSLKKVRLNVAMPMDHRVQAYKAGAADKSVMAAAFRSALSGPPVLYVDSPDAYREDHQVASSPSGNSTYWSGTDGTGSANAPLSRILPPGSEQKNAEYAATRRLVSVQSPHRSSSWSMIGIRPEFRAGVFLGKVKVLEAEADDADYVINGPVEVVTFDFANQETRIGNVLTVRT
jgi:hypothetical protein